MFCSTWGPTCAQTGQDSCSPAVEGRGQHESLRQLRAIPSPSTVGDCLFPSPLRICLALSLLTSHPLSRISVEAVKGPALSAELLGTEPSSPSGPEPPPQKADCPLTWAVSRCEPSGSFVLDLEVRAEATLQTCFPPSPQLPYRLKAQTYQTLRLFTTSFGSSLLHVPPFPDILFPVLLHGG